MAAPLISLEEAARLLGKTTDEVKRLLERRELYAVRDGATWKFKPEEIQRYQREASAGKSGTQFELPGVEEDSDSIEIGGAPDVVLLSEEELGGSSPSTSSTVIGPTPPGKDVPDSDLRLATDSDLKLVADAGSGSDVRLVPSEPTASGSGGSDLELLDLDDSGSGVPLQVDSGVDRGKSGQRSAGGSDVTLDMDTGDELALAGSTPSGPKAPASEVGSDITLDVTGSGSGQGSSSIRLASDDEDIVLGGSSVVSGDIADSGINLEAANDSGISLEEPLQLASEELSSADEVASSEVEALGSDDEFNLTPMLELDDEESDSSGSQVIALDSEAPFDETAATLLQQEVPAMAEVVLPDVGVGAAVPAAGGPLAAQQPVAAFVPAVAPGTRFSGLSVFGLTLVTLVLLASGMMMYDMLMHMWSWDEPYTLSSTIMDALLGLFESK
jgi:excisionase family DNA binding protein